MRTPNPKTRRSINAVLSAVLALQTALGALVPTTPAQAIIANGMPAIDVIGQYNPYIANRLEPYFTKRGVNNGPTILGFSAGQRSMAIDTVRHRLFLPDSTNNRVLVFNLDASNVL